MGSCAKKRRWEDPLVECGSWQDLKNGPVVLTKGVALSERIPLLYATVHPRQSTTLTNVFEHLHLIERKTFGQCSNFSRSFNWYQICAIEISSHSLFNQHYKKLLPGAVDIVMIQLPDPEPCSLANCQSQSYAHWSTARARAMLIGQLTYSDSDLRPLYHSTYFGSVSRRVK